MATDSDKRPNSKKKEETGETARFWHPRAWHGMTAGVWFGLLWRTRFAVAPYRWSMAAVLCVFTVSNSFLGLLQGLIYGRRIARTRIEKEPIFIIGHWRSGTTLLHELLVLDERHTYPSTLACFMPDHFLVSRWVMPWFLKYIMPKRRPMDNMRMGWDLPQEDEFALCNKGIPSPYLEFGFPNLPPQYPEYMDLEDISPEARERWKNGLLAFLKCLTVREPKRIVLKSPLHTCRVKVLAGMFPKARFVHIVRDPFALFPSTVRMWRRMSVDQGLQKGRFEDLDERVLTKFERMYETFEATRHAIAPERFVELRYEDLVADPLGQIERIYTKLDLDEFEAVRPAVQQHVAGMKGYKPNRHQLSPENRRKVITRWAAYFRKYGYSTDQPDEA